MCEGIEGSCVGVGGSCISVGVEGSCVYIHVYVVVWVWKSLV